MAQYSLPGVYGWGQPDHPAAKVYVAPLDPGPYNLHSLKNTARPQLTTPAPRPGKSVQSAYFDRLGPTAAKLIVAPLLPGSKYSRGPLEKRGRMSFESVIPVPVPTDREYRFSFLKGEIEAAKQADREAPAATSIFSNMKPLQLVEALIKAAPDTEKKAAFEAVRNFLTRAELVKLNRPLTGQEQKEYDDIVNGLQINALEAYGDGTTQFADVVYDLGIALRLSNHAPPDVGGLPPPPGPPPPPAPFVPGAPIAPIVPVPPSELKGSRPLVPNAKPPGVDPTEGLDSLPDEKTIDGMRVEDLFPILLALADPSMHKEIRNATNDWAKLMAKADASIATKGKVPKALRREIREAAEAIAETTKQTVADYRAEVAAFAPISRGGTPMPSSHGTPAGSKSLSPLALGHALSATSAAATTTLVPLALSPAASVDKAFPELADISPTAPKSAASTSGTTTSSTSTTDPAAAVPPDPLAAATAAATSTASTHPLIAGPQPVPVPGAQIDSSTTDTTTIHTAATTAAATPKAKKTGVEKKLPPMVRAMQAADYVNQPGATKRQKKNAELVVEAKGDLTDPKVKSAWDSMRQARKELHKKREWMGPWYKEEVWAAAEKAGLDHPSKLPTVGKEAAPSPEADPSAHMVGTGRGSGLPFAMPKRNWSQWSPSTW